MWFRLCASCFCSNILRRCARGRRVYFYLCFIMFLVVQSFSRWGTALHIMRWSIVILRWRSIFEKHHRYSGLIRRVTSTDAKLSANHRRVTLSPSETRSALNSHSIPRSTVQAPPVRLLDVYRSQTTFSVATNCKEKQTLHERNRNDDCLCEEKCLEVSYNERHHATQYEW